MMRPLPSISQLKQLRQDITRFMMMYKFALDELETKVEILKEEFQFLHDYNPIEHTNSRLKSLESLIGKVNRKRIPFSLESIRENIRDIAGLRITCSFLSDIYRIRDMLLKQSDLTLLEEKDYIRKPKANGYQSLHLIVMVPVYMSDREEKVCVEVQIRTIAMDFWASLEHKIYYKYDAQVPARLLEELKEAADTASALDRKMEELHREIEDLKSEGEEELGRIVIDNQQLALPPALLHMLGGHEENSTRGGNEES